MASRPWLILPPTTLLTGILAARLGAAAAAAAASGVYRSGSMTTPASLTTAGRVRSRKEASVLYSLPRGWRRARS